MTPPLPSPLSTLDRLLLNSARRCVPAAHRPDWLRCWQAELWHRRHPERGEAHSAADLYPGLLRDALWLRQESWRSTFAGTALLCLVTLDLLALIAALPLLAYFGDLRSTAAFLVEQVPRFLIEAVFTTFVGLILAARSTEHNRPHDGRVRLQANLFLLAKLMLLQIIAYLLSVDLTQPFHERYPLVIALLQPHLCVIIALIAIRWSMDDQDTRCRHCLRSLSEPLRVGRPSWNFLDSNGTQLSCPDGHGLLSVPEIETSWRQSSEWIAQ